MAHRNDQRRMARERLAAEQAAQEAAARRQRLIRIAAVVVALVVVVAGGVWWQVQRTAVSVTPTGPSVQGERLPDGVAVGAADAPTLDVYMDFLCPHCLELEERIGDTIDYLVTTGDARLVLRPITLIDETESARSAAALGCAADSTAVLGFEHALFQNAGGGFSTDRLVEFATVAGLDDDVAQCIRDDAELDWAAAVDAAATAAGVEGTPAVFVDGVEMPLESTSDPETFLAAFEDLVG